MISLELQAQIIGQAHKSPFIEVCGLILETSFGVEARLCRNIAEAPAHRFILAPEDYLNASRQGKVVGVYHSHISESEEFSAADISACNAGNCPWYVYSLQTHKFSEIYPTKDIAPLRGREFVWGVHDCWTLIYDYYRLELGITLPPYEAYEERFWEKGHNYYIERYATMGFRLVVDESPQPHDVLLMMVGAPIPNHAAVYLGGDVILHHVGNRLSCEDNYGGYWRKHTTLILRHNTL